MGSPETVSVSHKANALCYNTVSLLPVRLIRAPFLKPRPRSQAGRSAANVCLAHLPAVPARFVGAACMRPATVCLVATVFGSRTRYRVFVGEAYMPPGRGERSREVCGEIDRSPRFVGRGLDPAVGIRPTIPFFGCDGIRSMRRGGI